jgi:hypothetical protein
MNEKDLEGLSKEEIESLKEEDEEVDLLKKVAGEDEPDEELEEKEEPKAEEKAEEKEEEKAEEKDEEEPAIQAKMPVIPQLSPPDQDRIEDYESERSALLEERKRIRQKYRDGELGADEYDEQLDQINEKISLLDRRYDRQILTESYNRSLAAASAAAMLEEFKRNVRENEGIDYDSNPVLLGIWDQKMKALAAMPEHSNKSYQWFLSESHKLAMDEVRQIAGLIERKQKAPQPDPESIRNAVRAREVKANVKNLARAPAAADTESEDAEFASLEGLSGLELERAIARMTPEQQKRYLEG